MTQLSRRDMLRKALAVAALGSAGALPTRLALAAAGSGTSRLVVVILRGALDGLALLPPVGDPDYAALRGDQALSLTAGERAAIPLQGPFALHPSLSFLAERWQSQQLLALHAVASPYRERSHFDGQDVLESGYARPHAAQTGWLNRALPRMAGASRREAAVALGTNVPLILRGSSAVAAWSPSRLPMLDDDTLQRLADLYGNDSLLAGRLADALATEAMVSSTVAAGANAGAQLQQTVQAAAGFLKREDGPRVAVFDTSGWDTHANEGGAQGALAQRLGVLDQGLRSLCDNLGDVWQHTAVVVVTEFGRTAAINGTRGTDHGTGAAALLVGGAVKGGKVIADWPGLSAKALYAGRDLQPTLDLRSVFKTLLRDHLAVPRAHIDSQVFPDSAAATYLPDLLRSPA